MMEEIRFDDVEALRKHVSDEYGPWGTEMEVSQKMIDEFAELTGDRQWIHIDVERCKKESPFGTTIAHGFLTLSLLPSLSGGARQGYRIVGAGNVTNYGADGFRFLSPVPAGSKLHARSRLKGIEATPKGTRVATETAIHVVGSERPALVYEGITLYQAPR
jgi:acyl dehydratase